MRKKKDPKESPQEGGGRKTYKELGRKLGGVKKYETIGESAGKKLSTGRRKKNWGKKTPGGRKLSIKNRWGRSKKEVKRCGQKKLRGERLPAGEEGTRRCIRDNVLESSRKSRKSAQPRPVSKISRDSASQEYDRKEEERVGKGGTKKKTWQTLHQRTVNRRRSNNLSGGGEVTVPLFGPNRESAHWKCTVGRKFKGLIKGTRISIVIILGGGKLPAKTPREKKEKKRNHQLRCGLRGGKGSLTWREGTSKEGMEKKKGWGGGV